jgi:tRNA (adenine57-N1/adenine58-N1)-methyltransferase catalytic subunit
MKTVINKTNKYLVKDSSKDYHSEHGVIKAEDMAKGKAVSNKNVEFSVFDSRFIDIYEKMKRRAQIITLKDIGTIITQAGLGKESVVVDAGTGSGALACFLGHVCKKVVSYDIREEHQKVAVANAEMLGLKNIDFKIGDVREGISEKDVDVVVLDMADPWNAVENACGALKKGGFLVVYSPTVPQVMDTVEKIKANEELVFIKVLETIEREWEVDERKVRPKSSHINHTAFLTFGRKI